MYRNCVYNGKEKKIHLWTWDSEGNRVREDHNYKPYLMLEDKKGEFRSIYGTNLKKIEFNSNYDRNDYIKDLRTKRIFENLPPYQQFLIDNYWHSCENPVFSQFPLKICYFDIECPGSSFAQPENPDNVINLLTCYDSITRKYTVFGLKSYIPSETNVVYHHCKSEHDLLKKFINHFASDYPDLLVGWNSAGFDIPYLINRITFEIGKEWADKLSPIGRIYEKINPNGKFGAPTKEYVIDGISCVDYYVIYQKFNLEKQESYKLDHIGEVELGINKVEHDGSLWELCKKDWDTFVEYNLRDVEIIVGLEDKLKYMDTLRFLSYTGLCSLEKAIGTVSCMNGAIAIRARHRDEYIPTFVKNITDYKAPGGYVYDPIPGFYNNIVSFDANSLYPSVMITLNLSPETKLGRLEVVGDQYKIHHVSGKVYTLNKENFIKFLNAEKVAISKSNFLFSQKRMGIVPEFLDNLYSKRKEMKYKMLEARKQGDSVSEKLFDSIQYAYKIHLNSLYGYMLNKHALLGDEDIGTSVTTTGQAVIKESLEIYKDFLTDKLGDKDAWKTSYIYSDTDSGFFSFNFIDKLGISLLNGDELSSGFIELCEQFENYMNDRMNKWAKSRFRSVDPRFVFKRETVCDTGIFLKKKYYVLRVLDDEGVPVKKFKYKGVDVVKTTMPKKLKPYVKKVIEHMILSKDLKTTNQLFSEAYDIFKSMPIEEISSISGMNNLEEYSSKCKGFETAKSMPVALKCAYLHDKIIENVGESGRYEKFKSGDKIRMVLLQTPNKYNIDRIGFKSNWPKEFDEFFKVDYEKMFAKIFYAAIKRFYDAVNWKLRMPSDNVKNELDDIFGD
jgi:DNA polymerase elongation subunit (family B)